MSNDHIEPMVFLSDIDTDEVRGAPSIVKKMLFIAGFVDFELQEVVLFKGNEDEVIVPFSFIIAHGKKAVPNFSQLEITSLGNLIKFGNCELYASQILYWLDDDNHYKEVLATEMVN